MDNALHHSALKRAAAWTALFAILLIVVAPLISISLQKDPMSTMPGMHHDMSAMPMDDHHSDTPHSMPVDHAEACGYCVLMAHVPGMILALVVVLSAVLQRLSIKPPRPVVSHWHYFPGCILIRARRRRVLLFPVKNKTHT